MREISWARDGLNFLIHSGDILAMAATLTREVRELRAALGDTAKTDATRAESI